MTSIFSFFLNFLCIEYDTIILHKTSLIFCVNIVQSNSKIARFLLTINCQHCPPRNNRNCYEYLLRKFFNSIKLINFFKELQTFIAESFKPGKSYIFSCHKFIYQMIVLVIPPPPPKNKKVDMRAFGSRRQHVISLFC